MSEVKLGEILTPSHDKTRDAIHVGVVPVVAGEGLRPAQKVKVRDGVAYPANASERYTGIVDPFLWNCPTRGDWFWLLMAPGEVEKLRHYWDHEDLDEERGTGTQGAGNQRTESVPELEDDDCAGCYE